jgi:soluble lytic murein transglycosylase-like protein
VKLVLGGLALAGMLPVLAATQRPDAPRPSPAPPPGSTGLGALPVEQWTARILALQDAREWGRLAGELEQVRASRPDLYEANALGYLQARSRMAARERTAARQSFQPYLARGHFLRDLALYHLARLAQSEGRNVEASSQREELIFGHPQGNYRARAVEEQIDYLGREAAAAQIASFAERLGESAGAPARRQVQARLVEALIREGQNAPARERGLALLRDSTADDPADRASRALDAGGLVEAMDPEGWALVAEAARSHRRFDRAIPLLQRAIPRLPGRRDELLFNLGRAFFFAERFPEAERTFTSAAAGANSADARASFLYQASRAAQLQDDDKRAERHLTAAIESGRPPRGRRGRSTPTATASAQPRIAVALTQRLRIRAAQKRLREAEKDLRRLQRAYPRSESVVEGTLAYAMALVLAGKPGDARRELEALGRWHKDDSQAGYWLGRAREGSDPRAALAAYLDVLRGSRPTHLALFARGRVDGPLREVAARESARLAGEAQAAADAGDLGRARTLQTDAFLLAPPEAREEQRSRLGQVYRRLPEYQSVLDLRPRAYPALPVPAPPTPAPVAAPPMPNAAGDRLPAAATVPSAPVIPPRGELLMALGLFDDAADYIPRRYPLDDPASALTQAEALYRGGVPPGSIRAAEGALADLPAEMVPELMPRRLSELLYPRHFWERVVDESTKHGADPRLVLSVMREESRFDLRAKSPAAARGLLQFIIGTARAVGEKLGLMDVQPEDLYQADVIIPLGAKYLADLVREFDGDRYEAVAAYNAGPPQARLWARLAPPEPEAFYSSVNFDETRRYVGRVLSTYERYKQIYE